MRIRILVMMAVLLVGATIAAQAADAPSEKMEAFSKMVGVWEGSGSMQRGPDESAKFLSREVVESRLEGAIVVVEGTHWSPDRSAIVHHAMAVIAPAEGEGYSFSSWLANGRSGDYRAWFEGDDLIWEIPSPAGKIRYVITIEGDKWVEVGKIEREGKWREFFWMNLERVK